MNEAKETFMSYCTADPRPDFTEDSPMWSILLQLAAEQWPEWFLTPWAYLWSARCAGARLEGKSDGRYQITPTIGEADTWPTWDDWEEMRDAYLRPHAEVIVRLVSQVVAELSKVVTS